MLKILMAWLRRKVSPFRLPGPRLRLRPDDLIRIRRRVDHTDSSSSPKGMSIILRADVYALLAEVEWWRRQYGEPPPHPQGYGVDMKPYPEFRRADGNVLCERCGKPYRKHGFTEHRDWNNDPWLVELCDGSLVKL